MKDFYDVAIIGAGPAGLAAAKAASALGASVIILEREARCGGILNQCIHDGFGLMRYHRALTGPEYAARAIDELEGMRIDILTDAFVSQLVDNGDKKAIIVITRSGLLTINTASIVLATGCRERTRGQIRTPGSRPSGVFTAGLAQSFVNLKGMDIGHRVVILGSGDIGLIMARRLTLEGAKVLGVYEILSKPCGLKRNITQCLYDFGIPLETGMTVSRIIGSKRLEAVEVSQVDSDMKAIDGTARIIECDTLILSVGLIPENELASDLGVKLDPKTNGALTDAILQTSVPGVFACGNCRKVLDLADLVSRQAETAGANAARHALGLGGYEEAAELDVSLPKGWPEKDVINCTLCPRGCSIAFKDGEWLGYGCKRGLEYAKTELVSPMRTLTATVLDSKGHCVPIKSSVPVPRSSLVLLRQALKSVRLADHHSGQVACTIDGIEFLSAENG